MIDKDKCAACNQRGDNLVEFGGWYYHRDCLKRLRPQTINRKVDQAMFQRLNQAFNKIN